MQRVELQVIVTCFYLSRDMANNATELEPKSGVQAIVECCEGILTYICAHDHRAAAGI